MPPVVLVVLMWTSGGSYPAVTMQEFDSYAACERVLDWIKAHRGFVNGGCFRK